MKSELQCQLLCQERESCTRFVFAPKDGNCCMKTTLKEEMVEGSGLIAGPKFCSFGKLIIDFVIGMVLFIETNKILL